MPLRTQADGNRCLVPESVVAWLPAVIQLSPRERYAEAMLHLLDAKRRLGPFHADGTTTVEQLQAKAEKARTAARVQAPYVAHALLGQQNVTAASNIAGKRAASPFAIASVSRSIQLVRADPHAHGTKPCGEAQNSACARDRQGLGAHGRH